MNLRNVFLASAALLLPPASLLAWYAGWFSPTPPDPWQFITDAGYEKLAPPSRLSAPGTLTTVEKLSNGNIRLHLACRTDNDVLMPLAQVSDTVTAQFGSRFSEAFTAESKAFGAAAAKATGNRVKQVSVALTNMKIMTVPREDLFRVRNGYLKGSCQESILNSLREKADVCQVEEVLKADVVYRMSFADALDSTQRAELAKEVSASLNLGAGLTGVDEVRGENLYFGVRVSLRCLVAEPDVMKG